MQISGGLIPLADPEPGLVQSQTNTGGCEALGQAEELRHFLLGKHQVMRRVARAAAIVCTGCLHTAEHMPGLPAGREYPVAELQLFCAVFQHTDASQLPV